jgi:hypothetical protein
MLWYFAGRNYWKVMRIGEGSIQACIFIEIYPLILLKYTPWFYWNIPLDFIEIYPLILLKYTPWFYRNNLTIAQYRYTAVNREKTLQKKLYDIDLLLIKNNNNNKFSPLLLWRLFQSAHQQIWTIQFREHYMNSDDDCHIHDNDRVGTAPKLCHQLKDTILFS